MSQLIMWYVTMWYVMSSCSLYTPWELLRVFIEQSWNDEHSIFLRMAFSLNFFPYYLCLTLKDKKYTRI